MAFSSDTTNLGEDGFADSGGVRIHYVTSGTGPLVVLTHGIPGFWYDWRHVIPLLAATGEFDIIAPDDMAAPSPAGFALIIAPAGALF